ncbi:hypothetical protein [Ensifer sp. ZNC0028]|uniref:hypothetical protein n=1 Tax=Ensifer sp. ZNC0028 TaxID=1339236 RepID=UPI000AE6A051|nr:hypothetical protein [Ensifer sp. ZNC0028]
MIGMTGTLIVSPARVPASPSDPMQHEVKQGFAVHAVVGDSLVLLMDCGTNTLTPKIVTIADFRDGETGPGWQKFYHLHPVEKVSAVAVAIEKLKNGQL